MVEEMADGPKHPKDISHEGQQTQGEMLHAPTDMEDEELLEEGPNVKTETRVSTRGTMEHDIGTPDRPRKDEEK